MSKYDLGHLFWSHLGPLQDFFDDSCPQLVDRHGGQGTIEGAYNRMGKREAIGTKTTLRTTEGADGDTCFLNKNGWS